MAGDVLGRTAALALGESPGGPAPRTPASPRPSRPPHPVVVPVPRGGRAGGAAPRAPRRAGPSPGCSSHFGSSRGPAERRPGRSPSPVSLLTCTKLFQGMLLLLVPDVQQWLPRVWYLGSP